MNGKSIFVEGINKVYKNITFFDKYGGSVIVTIVTLLIFSLLFSYYWINSQVKPIKADWANMKCHPAVIPYAGYINAPPGVSLFDYTAENFNACLFNVLGSIVSKFTSPVYFLTGSLTDFFQLLVNMVNSIRSLVDYLRTKVMAMIMSIIDRFINSITPIYLLILRLKSLMGKVSGIMISGIYTAVGSYLALKSFMGAFLQLIILALIVLAGVVIVLWIFPWTWALAYVGTAAYVAIAIPTVIIGIWMAIIIDMTNQKPEKCCCFDENTKIVLKNGKKIKIKNIKLGSILKDGSIVTSKMKILNTNKEMYNINGVIVSGTHFIKDNESDGWVEVKNYNYAKKITDYSKEFIYCINTSSKVINIGSDVYLDWDDITQLDIVKLKNNNYINMASKSSEIHNVMEGGFNENTFIETENGNSIKITNLIPGTILKYGEVVKALVEVDANNLNNIKTYTLNDNKFVGRNLLIKDNLGVKHSDDLEGELFGKCDKLYHILTNTGTIYINGVTFYDYDGALVQTLDINENKKKCNI